MKETAADLAVALALLSVKGDVPIPQSLMALGEIGLTGEIMPVSRITLRLKEALKMKFTHFLLSDRNKKEVLAYYDAHHLDEARKNTIFVRNLKDVMEAVK